jgi:mono/diheme cytochrome c family protein
MQRVAIIGGLFFATALVVGTPSVAQAQDAAAGEKVYVAQKCSVCHSIAAKGGKSGGALDGVGTKLTADQIREWIVDPAAAAKKANSTKKPVMPPKYGKLPKADIDGLVAYMASLKK